MEEPLVGRVAVVAGATRGAGRGIARMLGEAGATVYCSGRSVAGQPATGTRPETIEQTADLVTAAGGRGIAVQTDHLQADQVERLFARVSRSPAASTSWSTTSGAATTSPNGARRSGSSIRRRASPSSTARSRRTS